MKRLIFSVIIFSLSFSLSAQKAGKPKTDFTKMYLPVWLEAKAHCLAVARAMPADKYDFKPTDVSKSFAEQMVHIGYTVELLTKRYVEGLEVVAKTPDASTMTKEEIIALVYRSNTTSKDNGSQHDSLPNCKNDDRGNFVSPYTEHDHVDEVIYRVQ